MKLLSDMGLHKGELNTLRETVLDVLDARFGVVPREMIDQIRAIDREEWLKNLHKEAILCPDIGSFSERMPSEAG